MFNLPTNIVVAQVFALLAMIVFSLAPHQKKKSGVLIFHIMANALYATQYFLLSAYPAIATNILSGIETIVLYVYMKKNKEVPVMIVWIYSFLILIIGVFTYQNIYSILPIFISIVYAYGTWQSNLRIYRIISVIGCTTWIIYNYVVQSYVGALGSAFQLVLAIIAIIRFDILKKEIINNKKQI